MICVLSTSNPRERTLALPEDLYWKNQTRRYHPSSPMKIIVRLALLFICLFFNKPAAQAKEVTIYRDEFGIPHVFADSLEGAAYAVGYAQAEDRLEELLKNYRKANGTMSEVFGPENFRHDLIQRMWRHSEISRE